MKYFRVGLPVVILLTIIVNGVLAFQADNGAAVSAYWLAFIGWLVMSVDEVLHYRKHYMNKDLV